MANVRLVVSIDSNVLSGNKQSHHHYRFDDVVRKDTLDVHVNASGFTKDHDTELLEVRPRSLLGVRCCPFGEENAVVVLGGGQKTPGDLRRATRLQAPCRRA